MVSLVNINFSNKDEQCTKQKDKHDEEQVWWLLWWVCLHYDYICVIVLIVIIIHINNTNNILLVLRWLLINYKLKRVSGETILLAAAPLTCIVF